MKHENEIETKDFQAQGYYYTIIPIPDPNVWNNGGEKLGTITDTPINPVVDEYIARYSEAWSILSDM